MQIPRYAIIATHNRYAELSSLVASITRVVDDIIVIDNASSPPIDPRELVKYTQAHNVLVIREPQQPPNLSFLWNAGIIVANTYASLLGAQEYDIAIFNDDAVVPVGWFDNVSRVMRKHGCAAGCSDPHGKLHAELVKREHDGDIGNRMCGWAFMLRGELKLRADERFQWWWGDTDLDWQARESGGLVIIPGYPVANLYANQSTQGELLEQTARDRLAFVKKWGSVPW